jgi:uncharacterized protein YaiL (DUF2058 family)
MNSSLRDQLLAAGLVTEKQAKQAAQQEQQRQFRDRSRPNPGQRPAEKPASAPRGPAPTGAGQNNGSGQPNKAPGQAAQQAPSAKAQAQSAQAAKVARDQELNRRREDKAQRRARLAQIEQIIEQNRVPRLETEDHYSFIDGKKIRRMSVDAQRREQLTRGELVIVRYRGHYAVVPAAIAERIRERDANMVVPLVQPKSSAEPDDAYKDFVVPDDLMW